LVSISFPKKRPNAVPVTGRQQQFAESGFGKEKIETNSRWIVQLGFVWEWYPLELEVVPLPSFVWLKVTAPRA
jgi:hypothetical protein